MGSKNAPIATIRTYHGRSMKFKYEYTNKPPINKTVKIPMNPRIPNSFNPNRHFDENGIFVSSVIRSVVLLLFRVRFTSVNSVILTSFVCIF